MPAAIDLNDRVAVVTGSGMGLGLAIATQLARAGADIAVLERNAEAAPRRPRIWPGTSFPQGRLGDPADVGQLVAYLCSVHAAYISGSVVTIDGGLTSIPAG